MHIHKGISALALIVAVMATGSAQGQILDLGGSGSLLNLGGGSSDSGQPDVTVNTGGGSPEATVDLGGATSGDSSDNPTATVDLGGDSDEPTAVVDLNGASDSDDGTAIVDLNTGGTVPGTGGNVLGTGGSNDVGVSLFGDGTPDVAVGGNDTDATVDVLGNGGAGGTVLPGDLGLLGLGGGDGTTAAVSLFGPGADDDINAGLGSATETSSNGGAGAGGAGGSGLFGGSGSMLNSGGNSSAGASTRVATRGQASCIDPDASQVKYLLQSRNYGAQSAAQWQNADTIQFVPVQLCKLARARVSQAVASDSNIQWMQQAIENIPQIEQRLHSAGLTGDDVLALDSKSGKVALYVY
jgi:hypothetical protein